MVHSSATGQRAAAAAADSGPASGSHESTTFAGPPVARRRPHLVPKADRLEQLKSRLERLIDDVRGDAVSHRQFERQVDEAEAIAAGIRATFRGPGAAQNPPLQLSAGQAWW